MSLIISRYNQEVPTSFNGMYDILTEQERENRLIELLAEILRQQTIAKIEDNQKPDENQHQRKKSEKNKI